MHGGPTAVELANIIFTPEKVCWAVNSFKPFKAPGRDGIFPAILQNSLEFIIEDLVLLMKSSFIWAYITSAWCELEVIFIPKTGNRPADSPKWHMPISLTSFPLKAVEKLIEIYVRETLVRYTQINLQMLRGSQLRTPYNF